MFSRYYLTLLGILLLKGISAQSITDVRPGTYVAYINSPRVLSCWILIDSALTFQSERTGVDAMVFRSGLKGRIAASENGHIVQVDSVLCQSHDAPDVTIDIAIRGVLIGPIRYQYCATQERDIEFEYQIINGNPIIEFQNRCYVWFRSDSAVAWSPLIQPSPPTLDSLYAELCGKE